VNGDLSGEVYAVHVIFIHDQKNIKAEVGSEYVSLDFK
jgi:hypothetical protein